MLIYRQKSYAPCSTHRTGRREVQSRETVNKVKILLVYLKADYLHVIPENTIRIETKIKI
jgi:hypothetical protein